MSNQERLFHAISFELMALLFVVPLGALLSGKSGGSMAAIGIGLSLFTVVWNYLYNVGFDRLFGADRTQRKAKIRVWHAVGFEGSLVFVTVPVIAWFLQVSWSTALLLEAGFLTFFFFYTIAFNWGYDKLQPYQRWVIATKMQ
ncbi:PACE efflux transporter [Vibrio sp. Vb2880]|uniref:PACE efflux transporter n=1 Tax=Vibrio TaxID=662 RepID=UPI00117D42C4|nr:MULTISPECIES: PACE efflux transporter [Vibrio]MBO0212162.1 PACE efflux transporter [Vibrio sp. Vb2880]MCG6219001.1 PACE efflux transporter [Vibrio furnissii]TRN26154.1 hypothetical protein DM784_02365 [Vibrio furnissii]WJG24959.1 PACE efflux transporter [Vibrio furnissii]